MSKPLVERYEQILAQDPASTLFVELAKALIEKGDFARANQVCEQGLSHHARSVAGRVLWGKSLIHLGRPAEAMEQFDQAIAIDRENPHAYNLISEVLLTKGLYRSALPVLKKAVALQPNEARLRTWLEETQRALAGGPPPKLPDGLGSLAPSDPPVEAPGDALGAPPPAGSPEASSAGSPAPGATGASGEKTHPSARVLRPDLDTAQLDPDGPTRELPVASRAPLAGGPPVLTPARGIPVLTPVGGPPTLTPVDEQTLPRGRAPALADDPHAPTAESPALAARRAAQAMQDEQQREPTVVISRELIDGIPPSPAQGIPSASGEKTQGGRSPERPSLADAPPMNTAQRRALLDDLPPPDDDLPPTSAPTSQPRRGEPTRVTAVQLPDSLGDSQANRVLGKKASSSSLLGDLPDEESSDLPLDIPKVEMSPVAAQAIAKQYEQQLREELAAQSAQKTFLQRHGVTLAITAVVGAAIVVGAGAFLHTRSVNRGRDLKDALAAAKKALLVDTPEGYRTALEALDTAVKMDDSSAEAWALTAYAHSVLYAEHGQSGDERQKAEAALTHPKVDAVAPALAVVARYHLAEAGQKAAQKKALLESALEQSELQELQGEVLLQDKKSGDAIAHFKRALELNPGNVRALVALGDYFRDAGDCVQALTMYGSAAQVSPQHRERVTGAAECRLSEGLEQDEALKELSALPKDGALSSELSARIALAKGRLLSATGQHAAAVATLAEGAKKFSARAFDFDLALGDAQRAGGDLEEAEKALETALKLRPRSDEAKEALGRVLLARDRERELLSRLGGEDGRKVALVRGMAYVKLADFKKARTELSRTQVNGKFPLEAVVALAMADAGEGEAERAQAGLEKVLASSKRAKTPVRVALGQIYWKRGLLDRARAQFEEAAKDPLDYEGACSDGRLYLSQGELDKAAERLAASVSRNGSHGEARHALFQALLWQGKNDEALKQAQAWQLDNPTSAGAFRDVATAMQRSGKFKEADAASARAVKLDSADVEAQRVRAEVLFGRGEVKGAFAALEKANKLDPKDAQTFCAIGNAFLRQGKPDNASKAFEAARKNDDKSACAIVGFAVAKLPAGAKPAQKDLSEVAKTAEDVWERAEAEAGLARAALVSGSANQARKAAEEAVKLAPQSAQAQLALALVSAKAKDEAKAKDAFAKAVALDPASSPIHLAYAEYLVKTDDGPGAVSEYQQFLKLGGSREELARVKKVLTQLKKKSR